MELTMLHKRVIGLDVHQAQIAACAIIEDKMAPVASSSASSVLSSGIGAHWLNGQRRCSRIWW
jgi:hypothetical protein